VGDDVLFLFLGDRANDKILSAWRGNLARATVRDLHAWIINVENISSFVVAYKRAHDQPPHGTTLVPVYGGSWAATLASTGLRSGDVVVLGQSISLPCTAYRLPTFRQPFTQFDLRENHRLQATLIDDAMFVWAPATWKRAAEAIKSLDSAMTWRAAVMRILAHHVATISGLDGSDGSSPNASYASMKAIKSLMRVWTALGPPSSSSSSAAPPPAELGVEAIHALTVLLSRPFNCGFKSRPMTAYKVGDALAALCALVAQSVPGAPATSEDAVAFVKEPAQDEDPAAGSATGSAAGSATGSAAGSGASSSTVNAALEQLVRVVVRTTNGGRDLKTLYSMPPSALRALASLFSRPFFATRGIRWQVASESAPSSASSSSSSSSLSSMNAMLLDAMFRAAAGANPGASTSAGAGEGLSGNDAMRLLEALRRI
jgi:hypothetical protein